MWFQKLVVSTTVYDKPGTNTIQKASSDKTQFTVRGAHALGSEL
jgi:hypothetical protein